MTWLVFTLIAMTASGIFGVLTYAEQSAMGDPANGRYRALLFAGVGYSLMAIVGSLIILRFKRIQWRFPIKGMVSGTLAGVASATSALAILLAFEAAGTPAVVMSIFFACVPLVSMRLSL